MTELIIDAGNTHIKLAWFEGNQLVHKHILPTLEVHSLGGVVEQLPLPAACLISSVSVPADDIKVQLPSQLPCVLLSPDLKLNFINAYQSPDTLGSDRLASMAAAAALQRNKAVMVIDAGSCITYDVLGADKVYRGGAISPGLRMRYEALAHFTSRLPLLSPASFPVPFTGGNTSESIHAGILHSILFEIRGWIAHKEREIGELEVILTGGDAGYFGHQLKNTNFVHPDFVLQGLHEILLLSL